MQASLGGLLVAQAKANVGGRESRYVAFVARNWRLGKLSPVSLKIPNNCQFISPYIKIVAQANKALKITNGFVVVKSGEFFS
jgi:hypothetical protein